MQETEAQKRERRHREDLERLRGFRPIDDTFMRGRSRITFRWQSWYSALLWESLI